MYWVFQMDWVYFKRRFLWNVLFDFKNNKIWLASNHHSSIKNTLRQNMNTSFRMYPIHFGYSVFEGVWFYKKLHLTYGNFLKILIWILHAPFQTPISKFKSLFTNQKNQKPCLNNTFESDLFKSRSEFLSKYLDSRNRLPYLWKCLPFTRFSTTTYTLNI